MANPRVSLGHLLPWDSQHLPVQQIPGAPSAFGGMMVPGQRGAATAAGGFNLVQDVKGAFDPHHYAEIASIYVPAALASGSVLALGQSDSLRNFLLLRNVASTANVYIDFGNSASSISPLKLTPGQIVLFDVVVPQNDIYVYGDASDGAAAVAYSTILKPTNI